MATRGTVEAQEALDAARWELPLGIVVRKDGDRSIAERAAA